MISVQLRHLSNTGKYSKKNKKLERPTCMRRAALMCFKKTVLVGYPRKKLWICVNEDMSKNFTFRSGKIVVLILLDFKSKKTLPLQQPSDQLPLRSLRLTTAPHRPCSYRTS